MRSWKWRSGVFEGGTAVVFDIDGVLSNAEARQHYIKAPRRDWKAFFSACGEDEIILETSRLLALIDDSVVVVLLTGRPSDVQELTVEWLDRHGLRWNLLIMRDRGDYDASISFKRGSVRQLRELGFDLRLAFEDDRLNREMFEEEGVPCMYVHSGYYEDRDLVGHDVP